MEFRIANTENIVAGTNTGLIGANNLINISRGTGAETSTDASSNKGNGGEVKLEPTPSGTSGKASGGKVLDVGNVTDFRAGGNTGNIGSKNNCNVSGGKGVQVEMGNVSNMVAGSNAGDIGSRNNCNVNRGEGVKIGIGNVSNVGLSGNAGAISSGNNCNVNGGKGVEIMIGNTANTGIGFNIGGMASGNNFNIN